MTTPTRRRTLRSRLLAFITDATSRLTTAWRILARAQTRLLTALAAIRPGRGATARIRAAEQTFRRELADFTRTTTAFIERWAATDLPVAYREGAHAALDHADRPHRMWAWTSRHQATITTLTAQYYADLMGRLREAQRRAGVFLRDALSAARTRTARFQEATFDPAELQRTHPLDTVIYANDHRHPVQAWAQAALAWQAVTTANAGSLQTSAEQLGCQQVAVRDGADCGWTSHDDPDRADGTLRDIDDALAHPTAHPHCIREFRPHLTRSRAIPGGLA
jgi:hypothetical protein